MDSSVFDFDILPVYYVSCYVIVSEYVREIKKIER